MKYNKAPKIILTVIFILISAGLSAMGRADDSEPQQVNGLENWDHSMDVSELPPGEYNIIVRGTDRAGNSGTGGPYNVFIDPAIQIPTVSISTPAEGSRVGNLVNIVGTAGDDIKVERVELAVDGGAFSTVNGTGFWAVTLDSSAWDDGMHTVSVKAFDGNGNESPVSEVSFFKDTVKPLINISSHDSGSYISGKISLEGTVTDQNGIQQAVFSKDDFESTVTLKLSKADEEGKQQFRFNLDTRDFYDGAHVFWIEAVDGLGSASKQSFLYYVDNSAPELSLLYPESEEAVNGMITLIGRAEDAVGLTSLSYIADNGESGDVHLSPGNPAWVLPLDYTGFKGKTAKIEMTLSDLVGNTVSETFKLPLDLEGDLPSPGLSVHSPLELYHDIPVISGLLSDDDGSSGSIEYSLNRGDWKSIEVDGPWSLSLDDAVTGINALELRAVDNYGLTGPVEAHEFFISEPEPVIIIDSHRAGEQTAEWFPGAVLDAGNPGILTGRFKGRAGQKLSWSLNNGEIKTITPGAPSENGDRPFEIKLPRNMESGRMNIAVFCSDSEGNEVVTETVYYNYMAPEVEEGEPVPDFVIPDSGGLHLIIPGKRSASHIMLDRGKYISGWSTDGDISSVELSGDADFLSVKKSGSGFRLTADSEGAADGVIITLRLANGKELESEPLNLAYDITPPELRVNDLSGGMTVGDEISISVEADDNTALSNLYYSLNGGKSFSEFNPGVPETVNLANENESLADLVIKGEDIFGNTSLKYIPLLRDTKAPDFDFITSDFERGSEQVTWSGRISDGDAVDRLEFSFLRPQEEGAEAEPDPVLYEAVLNGGIFSLDVNLTTLGFEPGDVLIEAYDEAGNIKTTREQLNIALNEGRPEVQINVPQENDAFETGFNLAGIILDREGIESIQYSLNGGAFRDAGSGSLFTIPLEMDEMNDNVNEVSVKAVDINGLESDIITRKFLISHDPPELEVVFPDLESVMRGTFRLEGTSFDVNGIKNIWVSHDNGISFQKADGQEQWSYLLDTKLFEDGVSSLLLKAEDNAGVIGYHTTLINVDNEAPELSLSKPADGDEIRSVLKLSGRAVDSSGLSSLKVYISPLDNNPDEPVDDIIHELSSRGTILEDIVLDDLPPGAYSIRAEAVDAAENKSTVSRVFHLLPDVIRPPVLLSPLPGEKLGPRFSIQGFLPDYSKKVLLLVNGEIFQTIDVNEEGYFSSNITAEDSLKDGMIELSLRIDSPEGIIDSEAIRVEYSATGSWILLDNLVQEQYVSDRYVIEGSAGYETDIEDPKELAGLQPKKVRFSLDGGKTFEQLRVRDGKWSYTLYREEVQDGDLYILAAAETDDKGSFARCRINMDTRPPELGLFEPEENQKIFGNLEISGRADDDEALAAVTMSLRDGDKDSYATPSFIQGMYFDASGLGATYFTAGLGLTFMDDNVKLQFQYGYAPTTMIDENTGLDRASRFGGNVFGGRLLANLAQVPFSWLFGPEFSAFSATAALGADFSYFSSNTVNATGGEDSWGVILAGLVGQVELPKITFDESSFLKYVSVYWDGHLWLISSDISPEVVLLPSIGLRLGLF